MPVKYDHPKVDIKVLNGFPAQMKLYTDYCKDNPNNAKWIAFFDDDEMLYLDGKLNINEFLKSYEHHSGVCFNMLDVSKIPVEKHRPKDKFYNHFINKGIKTDRLSHVKTIVKPDTVINWPTPHLPLVNNGICVLYDQTPVPGPVGNKYIETNVLFHYALRTHDEFVLKYDKRNRATVDIKRSSYTNIGFENFSNIINEFYSEEEDIRMKDLLKKINYKSYDKIETRLVQ